MTKPQADLPQLNAALHRLRDAVRNQALAPNNTKTLRTFSTHEVTRWFLGTESEPFPVDVIDAAHKSDPTLPRGHQRTADGQRGEPRAGGVYWRSLEEIERLRHALAKSHPDVLPSRPKGRPLVLAVGNLKGGTAKTTTALNLAHLSAIRGYRVLCIDCDPQASLSNAMSVFGVTENLTLYGVLGRDLALVTAAGNEARTTPAALSGAKPAKREIPPIIKKARLASMPAGEFIVKSHWSLIDIVPSDPRAALVELATPGWIGHNPDWQYHSALRRYLEELGADRYDIVICDCPPMLGYQSLAALGAADMLLVPTGPEWMEIESTCAYVDQVRSATTSLDARFRTKMAPARVRVLLTRYDSVQESHSTLRDALVRAGDQLVLKQSMILSRAIATQSRFLEGVFETRLGDATSRGTLATVRRNMRSIWEEVMSEAMPVWQARA